MTKAPEGEVQMQDHVRAAANGKFKVSKQQLIDLVEKYRQRTYVEDIEYIEGNLQGMDSLCEALDVNINAGISTRDLQIREDVFGTNYKAPPERTPFCELLLGALDDFMLKILIVCAIFSIVVEMIFATPENRGHAWVEGFAILVAVAVVSLVTAWSDYQKEGQFLKQKAIEENQKTVTVLRDEKEEVIHKNFIKVGDLIKIRGGMNVPVDGVIVKSTGPVMLDESAMTGESDHLPKDMIKRCLERQTEHEQEDKFSKTPHDVPSPVVLSGTQI